MNDKENHMMRVICRMRDDRRGNIELLVITSNCFDWKDGIIVLS